MPLPGACQDHPDRQGVTVSRRTHQTGGDTLRCTHPEDRLPLLLPYGTEEERRQAVLMGTDTARSRRHALHHRPHAEDRPDCPQPYRIRGTGTDRRRDKGGDCLPRLQGKHDAGTAEKMGEGCGHHQAHHLPFKPPHLLLATALCRHGCQYRE